jgi:hypothetical protein
MLRLLREALTGECIRPLLEWGTGGAITGRLDNDDWSLDWSLESKLQNRFFFVTDGETK